MRKFSPEEKQSYFEKELSKLKLEQSRIDLLSRLSEECKTKSAESIIIDDCGTTAEKIYYETDGILQKKINPPVKETERIKRQIMKILKKSSAKFLFLRSSKWYSTKVCRFSPVGEEEVLRFDVNSNHKTQVRILKYILQYLPKEYRWSAEEDYEILTVKGVYLRNIEIWYDRQKKTNRMKLIFTAFHYLPLLYMSKYYLSPYFHGWWDQERYLELVSILNTGNRFSYNAVSFIYNLDDTEKKTCYGFIMSRKSVRFTDMLQPFELPTKERKERI